MNIKKKTKKMSTEDKQLNLIETKVPDWTEDERWATAEDDELSTDSAKHEIKSNNRTEY